MIDARSLALAAALVLAASPSGPLTSGPARLAADLRHLYDRTAEPWERWRRGSAVRLPEGREVPREEAFRDHPDFVAAAAQLLASRARDDAALGAWLLGTVPPGRAGEAEPLLVEALSSPDPGAAFEAALALGALGGGASLTPLEKAATRAGAGEVRTAAAWSAREVVQRAGGRPPRSVPPTASTGILAPGFRRGVSWWVSEGRGDGGAVSFRRLASLGVTWVSIHTWDPLQRGLHEPVLAEPSRRFGTFDLEALVRNAHAAGLKVLFKPHLEMQGDEPTPEELRIFRGSDEAARHHVIARLAAWRGATDHGTHNQVEMGTEADWRAWFRSYEAYLVPYARKAQAAGADMFCVGREVDQTVIRREADWRRLVTRVRREFGGPLVYSANFDTWEAIRLWDALDFIGVSAYFPLSDRPDPSLRELEAGWARALATLEAASRRWGRRVLLTEAGYPSIPSAARAPWREERTAADVWFQARCYEATLRAIAARPWIEGVFFWLWERPSVPPFRDPSHALPGKPAAFVVARWYSAR